MVNLTNQNGESLTRLLKGIRQGQSIELLFLEATQELAKLLGQENVGEQIEKELIAIYGIGLENSSVRALKIEDLQNTKARLESFLELNGATLKEDEKKRMKNAIQEQEREIQRLETLQRAV